MLNGVHFCGIHNRLFIGGSHAQIKGGNSTATHFVLSGHVNSRL